MRFNFEQIKKTAAMAMIRMEWEHNFYGNDVFRTIVSTVPVQVVVVCWCGWSALGNPGPQKPDMMKQLENLPFPPWLIGSVKNESLQ